MGKIMFNGVDYTAPTSVSNDIEKLKSTLIYNLLADGTDFNTLTTQGNYFMYHTNTYTNKPPVSNGFVDVKVWGVVVKQIIWRQGTIGTNDHEIYERTGLTSNGTWSEWTKIMTAKNLTTSLAVTEEGSALDATVGKVLNDKITELTNKVSKKTSYSLNATITHKITSMLAFVCYYPETSRKGIYIVDNINKKLKLLSGEENSSLSFDSNGNLKSTYTNNGLMQVIEL